MFRIPLITFTALILFPLTSSADCMGPYPPSMVRAFVQNCAKDPKMMPFCSCVMDDIQKNIALADFIEIGNSAGGIANDPRFIQASKTCAPQIPSATPPATPAASSQPVIQAPLGVKAPISPTNTPR